MKAALLSAALPGWGQVYNRQLEKAFLFWIWGGILSGAGLLLLLLRALGGGDGSGRARPPLADFAADHGVALTCAWAALAVVWWGLGVWDARHTAHRIEAGEVVIPYGLKRQLVHVLAAQLLGFIPFVGIFFQPAVVAEAVEAVRGRRPVDHGLLLREGGLALVGWAITRVAFYGVWALFGLWLLWWLLRSLGAGV